MNFEKELNKRKKEEESKEEKIMKRYEGYVSNAYLIYNLLQYFIMKAKKAKHNEIRQMSHNKLLEKQEKLKELDIENDNQRKLILKKIQKMEKKKLDHDKEKDEFYKKIKEDLDNHFVEIKNNQKLLSKEVDEIRQDVLFYENYKFNLAIKKDKLNVNKRNQSLSKTLENQKEKENEMKQFKRIMSGLQDESVIKKTERQKRQLYNEKVKKEKEEKKKEEEKKLEKLGVI